MSNATLFSTRELSHAVRAKDLRGATHVIRTVGEAARFIRANLTPARRRDVTIRQSWDCLEAAASAQADAAAVANATIALEYLLWDEGFQS
jgi:hypothetical protein